MNFSQLMWSLLSQQNNLVRRTLLFLLFFKVTALKTYVAAVEANGTLINLYELINPWT